MRVALALHEADDVLVLEPGTTETEFQSVAGELPHPGQAADAVAALETSHRSLAQSADAHGKEVEQQRAQFAQLWQTGNLRLPQLSTWDALL